MDKKLVCDALARRVGKKLTVAMAKEVVKEAEGPIADARAHTGPNFLRISTGCDITPLLMAITRRSELWREDTYLRDYPQGPFGAVESIMLRFPEKRVFEQEEALAAYNRGESIYDQHENIDYPAYKLLPEARPLVMSLMSFVGGERLGRVMINKIKPGGRITPHADTPVHANYWDRFHIVVHSAPGVDFRCGNEHVYMATGEVWWFQNALVHEVVNNSAVDRIHLVIDIRTSK